MAGSSRHNRNLGMHELQSFEPAVYLDSVDAHHFRYIRNNSVTLASGCFPVVNHYRCHGSNGLNLTVCRGLPSCRILIQLLDIHLSLLLCDKPW